jgi:hypothetical protein
MGTNETKKTMRFWIFSGVVAIVASQLPLLLKKKQHDNQAQQQQQKRPWWIKLLIWALIAVTIRFIIWLFNFFT